jgi:hypothetical protein
VGVDRESALDEALHLLELQIAQRQPGEHEIGVREVRVHFQRVLDQSARGVEVERLLELDVRHPHERRCVLGRLLQHLAHDLLGVAGVVAREEQLGTPEQRGDVAGVRTLCRVEGVVGVVWAIQQISRAPDQRHAHAIVLADAILVVIVDQRQQDLAARRSFTAPEQELPQEQARAPRQRLAREWAQERLGVAVEPAREQTLGLERRGLEARLGLEISETEALICVRVTPRLEPGARETEPRARRVSTRELRAKQRLGFGVARRCERTLGAFDRAQRGRGRRRDRGDSGRGWRGGARCRRAHRALARRDREQTSEQRSGQAETTKGAHLSDLA